MNSVTNLTLVDVAPACVKSNMMNMMGCLWRRRGHDPTICNMFLNPAWHACPRSACHVLPRFRCRRVAPSHLHCSRVLPLRVIAWLQPPRGSVAPPTAVDVRGHLHECLACHFTDRDRLPQALGRDRDHGVPVAILGAGLVAWNDHVGPGQDVACSIETWHACHRVQDHLADLTHDCVTNRL